MLAATVLSLALFIALIAARGEVDVRVLADRDFVPRLTNDGGAVASFVLLLSNRRDDVTVLDLSAAADVLYPDRLRGCLLTGF